MTAKTSDSAHWRKGPLAGPSDAERRARVVLLRRRVVEEEALDKTEEAIVKQKGAEGNGRTRASAQEVHQPCGCAA